MYDKRLSAALRTSLTLILLWSYLIIFLSASSHLTYGEVSTQAASYLPVGSTTEYCERLSVRHIDNYPILFIGDSRTVGMQSALNASHTDLSYHTFLAKVGKGCKWLRQVHSTIENHTSTPHIVVINMGVNDLGNIQNYLSLYSEYTDTIWKDCPVYIVSVNPVRSPCTSVTNRQIEVFNQTMKDYIETQNASASAKAFPIRYIDTYSYLQEGGYQSRDGLHYSASTYQDIYRYILDCVEEPIGDGEGWYEEEASFS